MCRQGNSSNGRACRRLGKQKIKLRLASGPCGWRLLFVCFSYSLIDSTLPAIHSQCHAAKLRNELPQIRFLCLLLLAARTLHFLYKIRFRVTDFLSFLYLCRIYIYIYFSFCESERCSKTRALPSLDKEWQAGRTIIVRFCRGTAFAHGTTY